MSNRSHHKLLNELNENQKYLNEQRARDTAYQMQLQGFELQSFIFISKYYDFKIITTEITLNYDMLFLHRK